jgi:hypothetical protein
LRYKSFRIQNFKGIKDTTVQLNTLSGASVFAFVGLNESGKTTILEAIHSFSPDSATSELLGGDRESGVPYKDRVPRHLISTFTGDISVEATLSVSAAEKSEIAEQLFATEQLTLDIDSFPDDVVLRRYQHFENGDFKNRLLSLQTKFKVRGKKQKNWRAPSAEEKLKLRTMIYGFTPDIAYFPTFVFDFPDRIFLTERGDKVDAFYRSAFQDILDFDGNAFRERANALLDVLSSKLA